MIHQLGRDPRILQVLLDETGVFLVDLLRSAYAWLRRDRFLGLETRNEDEDEQRDQRGDAEFHPPIVIRKAIAVTAALSPDTP